MNVAFKGQSLAFEFVSKLGFAYYGGADIGEMMAGAGGTLVLAGENDTSTPPAAGRIIVDEIPGSRMEVIPKIAHLCAIEASSTVNQLIKVFLIQSEIQAK
jgi:pimeloyl-ACP methyl ester carboxylesterase